MAIMGTTSVTSTAVPPSPSNEVNGQCQRPANSHTRVSAVHHSWGRERGQGNGELTPSPNFYVLVVVLKKKLRKIGTFIDFVWLHNLPRLCLMLVRNLFIHWKFISALNVKDKLLKNPRCKCRIKSICTHRLSVISKPGKTTMTRSCMARLFSQFHNIHKRSQPKVRYVLATV